MIPQSREPTSRTIDVWSDDPDRSPASVVDVVFPDVVEEPLPLVDALDAVPPVFEVVVGDEPELSEHTAELPSTTSPLHAAEAMPMKMESERIGVRWFMRHMVPLTRPRGMAWMFGFLRWPWTNVRGRVGGCGWPSDAPQ